MSEEQLTRTNDKKRTEKPDKAAEGISKTPTWNHLLKFSFPTIISMLIMGTFGIVDGIFVARLIDPIGLAATGVVWPFLGFVLAIGFMLGVGGNAMIAKKIGEGRMKEARQNFSLITIVAIIISIAGMVAGLLFPDLVLDILGVDDFIRPMALDYLRPLLWFMPTTALGIIFQQFFITVGKAHYSAYTATIGGLLSAGLNYVFIRLLDMGIQGAALATSIGYTLPAVLGMVYFTFARNSSLHFVMPRLDFRALGRTCINGASEMVTMLASSITAVLMNNILLDLGGAKAQAAASIMFASMVVYSALFIGYASGVMPIVSFNFGKGDTHNLKKSFINSLWLIGIFSLIAVGLALATTNLLIGIYDVPVGIPMHEMAQTAIRFMALSFVFMGINSFASMFFTALNNGLVSSLLSLFRTLIFVALAFMTLPALFGLSGAWMAFPAAEVLGIITSVFSFVLMRKKYRYV